MLILKDLGKSCFYKVVIGRGGRIVGESEGPPFGPAKGLAGVKGASTKGLAVAKGAYVPEMLPGSKLGT